MSKPHKDDFQFEPAEEEQSEKAAVAKLKRLQIELKEAKDQAAEYLAGWQRARADYLNLQRETATERERISNREVERFLLDLLKITDNFDLAMSHQAAWEAVPANWRQGIEQIRQELQNLLRDYNLEVIDPAPGQLFDPVCHHAIGTMPFEPGVEAGTVAIVLQKGYKLKDKIIRPAQVKTYE